MDVEYKDATEWLEGLPVGAQVLTPDDWVFAKQAGGTWVFRFCPGHVTTAGMIAAHGMPELIDPAVWNEEAGCRQIGGALAYFDPFKRIERRVHGKLIRTYSSLVYKTSPCDPAMNGASNGRSMRARLPTAGTGMRGYPKAILGWARIVATYLPTRREAFPMDAIRTDGSDSAPCVRTR
jgi:hypothetical protein